MQKSSTIAAYPHPSPKETTAPYLVPTSGPPMALTWLPDPESLTPDPAEELWRRLEIKMGRRLRGPSLRDRGRWVVKMEKQASDFSVSAYLGFGDDTTVSEGESDGYEAGEAIFDIAAPLVTSLSSTAATPANTPCLRRETLQRATRVRRKRSEDEGIPRSANINRLKVGLRWEGQQGDISTSGLSTRFASHLRFESAPGRRLART